MSEECKRRVLSFQNLGDVIKDVRALHARGYVAVGVWDLAQACGHMNEWMRFPLDGFPKPPWPMRLALSTMRLTVGRRMLRKILEAGTMGSGNPTIPDTVHPPGGDESVAVDNFCATVDRLESFSGPIHPSPLFGEMDRETLVRLQLIHCAGII